jgi:site-specific DNA-methyltransferase (adenine-specific)
MRIKLSDVQVDSRQRVELENDDYPIHALASSIRSTNGPVQRIVVDENFNLIAGERRYEALKLLVLTHPEEDWAITDADVRGALTQQERYDMELEENLHRKNLTPKEYHTALLAYHTKQTADNPESIHGPQSDPTKTRWTQQDTAESLGKSRGKITQDLGTAQIMSLLSQEKQDEIYKRAGEKVTNVHMELQRMMEKTSKTVAAKEETERVLEGENGDGHQEVRLTDAYKGLSSLPDQSVDLIITDPPYGTLEGSAGDKGLGHTEYSDRKFSDDEDDVLDLLERTIPEMHRVLRHGCHLYLFCGIGRKTKVNFNSISVICEKAGFFVRTLPLIWCKSGIQGFKPPFTHWPLAYEAILFATTGKREPTNIPQADFLLHQPISGPQKKHRFEKPISLIQSLIKVSGVPDGRILDPFCGGGSILEAGRKHWMHVLGFDLDPEAFITARDRLKKWDEEILTSNPTQGEEMLQRVKAW